MSGRLDKKSTRNTRVLNTLSFNYIFSPSSVSSYIIILFYEFAILITRAEVGMYSVLVSGDSGALKREYTNQFRESLMIEALSKVQKMSPKAFQSKVSTEHMCILTMETFAKV